MDLYPWINGVTDVPLIVLRIAIGAIFLVHGVPKVTATKKIVETMGKPHIADFMRFLGCAEMAGAVAVLLGLLTPVAAAGLSIVMVGAMFLKGFVLQTRFNAHDETGWELDAMILSGTLTLFFLGAGRFSLDRLIFGA